jgi:6-phosphogluconolactonase (cycloisomerase 2 family)
MDQGNKVLNRTILKNVIRIFPAIILIAAMINTMSCGNTGGFLSIATNTGSGTPTSTSTAGTGSFAFVSNFAAGKVASFTRHTKSGVLTRTATTAAGAKSGPEGMAVVSSGQFLYVANRADDNIYLYTVNKSTGVPTPFNPTASISNGAGSGPSEMATNQAQTLLFVTGFNNGTVTTYTINTGTGVLTKASKLVGLTSPLGITLDTTGTFLFVADNATGLVHSFSIGAAGVLTEVGSPVLDLNGPGGHPGFIALDPGGAFIYVTDLNAGLVSILGVSAGTLSFGALMPSTTGPEVPVGIAYSTISGSGNFLFAANQGDASMWSFLITIAGTLQPPVAFATTDNLNHPTGVVVDPQNAFLYTTNQGPGAGAGTVTQFQLTPACINAGGPCFVGSVSTGNGTGGGPFDIILAN